MLFHDKLRRKGLKNKGHVFQTSACNMNQSRKNNTSEQSRRDSESSLKGVSFTIYPTKHFDHAAKICLIHFFNIF